MKTTYWKTLLKLEKEIRIFSDELFFVCLTGDKILFNELSKLVHKDTLIISLAHENNLPASFPIFEINDFIHVKTINVENFSKEDLTFLKIYLPYCFLSYHAKKLKRCIAVTHFAQSLDGKIATESGDSKWIGNEENLNHAHRMRALCNSILVGSNTVRLDQPNLTVRRVEGENPKRIILGSSEVDLSSLIACSSSSIIVINNNANYTNSQVEHFKVSAKNCKINSQDLLQLFFEKGIYSVYIEGGALTTSNFLKDKAVDILQLHLSPIIFGSGKQGISLPAIQQVSESPTFKYSSFYQIGDGMMFIGKL